MPLPDKRLMMVAEMLIKGESAADIGADHAHLSIFLVENNIVPRAIVTDLPDGPFNRAVNAVQSSACRDRLEVRQGDGLQVLLPGEVGNIIIAGMGGESIVEILSYDWDKAESYHRYIFQPMSRTHVLRSELSRRGWPILDEKLVRENQKYYAVISTCPGHEPYQLSPLELEVGPVILKKDSRLKQGYLEEYRGKYQMIYHNLINTRQENRGALLEEYKNIIEELEVILDAGKSQEC